MKRIITFLILICFGYAAHAQHWVKVYSYNEYLGLIADSVLIPPQDTTFSNPTVGSLAIFNGHVYQRLSTAWSQVDGGGNAVQSLTGSQSIQYGAFNSMPSPGTSGRFYAATDSSRWYFDNGTAWLNLSGSGGGGGGSLLTFGIGIKPGSYNGSSAVTINADTIAMPTRNSLDSGLATKQTSSLSPGDVWIGNGSGVAQQFAVTGDFSFSSSGVGTINANSVTLTKQAQAPANTIPGNNTGSTANLSYLTVSQVITMLNAVTNFGGNANFIGYGIYSAHPTSGTTGLYFATDSTQTGGWFYWNGSTMKNLTPQVSLTVLRLGQPGDSSMFSISGSILTGYVFNVAAQRDSATGCIHHTVNPDGSWTWYSTCVINAGNVASIQKGLYSARPAASGNAGACYIATDSAQIACSDGTSWTVVARAAGGGGGGGSSLPSGISPLYLQATGSSTYQFADPRQLDTLYIVDDGQSNDYGNADAGYIGDSSSDWRVQVADTVTGGWKVAHAGSYPFNVQPPTQYSLCHSFYFARKLARMTGKIVRLIHNGHNGLPIANWFTSGVSQPLLDTLVNRINRFVPSGYQVLLFDWDQGESDNGTSPSTYIAAWDSIKVNLHRRCPAFTMATKIAVVGMPQVAQGAPTGYQGIDPTLQQFDYNDDQRDAYINTDSAYVNTTVASNPVHFNADGLKYIGEVGIWNFYNGLPLYYTRNNPGTLAGAPLNPGRISVRYNESPGAGAYYDGVNTMNRTSTGRTGFRALSSDSTSTVGGVFLAGPSGSYFSANQLVVGTETNSDLILSRNFVNYLQFTSTGITMAKPLTYTSTSEAAFNNTTNTSGPGFSLNGDNSNFINLHLNNSASTIPNSFAVYVGASSNSGYKFVFKSTGTRAMDSSAFVGSIVSTFEDYGSRGERIDTFTTKITLNNHNNIVFFITASAIDTCYLPVSTGDYMRVYTIRKVDTGATGTVKILLASGSDKIDRSATSLTLTGSNPVVQVISNGVNGYYTLTPPVSSGVTNYQTVQASGSPQTAQPVLNFTGAANLIANNSGNTSTDVPLHGMIYSATANGTAYANSTTPQTALTGASGTGSLTVAANTMYAGETFTFHGWAQVSTTTGTQTLDIGPMVSTGSQWNDAILSLSGSLGNAPMEITASITILTTGSSGTYSSAITVNQGGGGSVMPFTIGTTGTLNTTVSNTFSIQATWDAADASNSVNLLTPFILKIE